MSETRWILKDRFVFVLKFMSAICLAAMVLINVVQVLCRYFIQLSFIWAEDISIYLLHWIVAFSMPLLWLLKEHMIMDVSNAILPKKVLDALDVIIDVFGVVFGVVFTKMSAHAAIVNKGYVMSIAGYDEMWKYVPYAIGGALLTIAALMNLYEKFIRKTKMEKVEVNG